MESLSSLEGKEKATEILIKSKRENYMTEIRKKSNTDFFNAKRIKLNYLDEIGTVESHVLFSNKEFHELAIMLKTSISSENYDIALKVVQSIRVKDLNQEEKRLNRDGIFQSEIVETMISLCGNKFNSLSALQYEACWVLVNICTEDDEKVHELMNKGLVNAFYDQLRQEGIFHREQAIWGLANLAGVSNLTYLKELLDTNIIEKVSESFFTYPSSEGIAENISSLANSLSFGASTISFDSLREFLPIVEWAVSSHINNELVINNSFWALVRFTENLDFDQISEIVSNNSNLILSALAVGLEGKIQNINILAPISKFIGNLIIGDLETTTHLIKNFRVIEFLDILLGSARKVLRKNALWCMANLLANSEKEVEAVFERFSVVEKLLKLAKDDPHFDIKKEALIALSNACCTGENNIVSLLVKQDIIELFCSGLDACDNTLILNLLQGLSSVLYYGRSCMREEGYLENPFVLRILDCKGHVKLEELQTRENPEIYKAALSIITSYFENEEMDSFTRGDEKQMTFEV